MRKKETPEGLIKALINKGFIVCVAILMTGLPILSQTTAELVRNAHDCFDTMDDETGLRLAARALESDPKRWTLRLRQAAVLSKLGRKEVAWLALERARSDAGKDAGSVGSYGPSALAALWKYQEGRRAEAEVLAVEAAHRAASSLHPDRGAKPDWAAAFAPGLREPPGAAEAEKPRSLFFPNAGLGSYILGALAESVSGWSGKTESLFLEALRLSYDAHDCALRIVLGRMGAGDSAGAVRAGLAACDEGGLHPDYCLVLAATYEAAGAKSAAEDFLALAVDLKPYMPIWLRAQAAAEAGSGRRAEAAAILRRVLRLSPADMTARDHLERLDGGRSLPPGAFAEALAAAVASLKREIEPHWTQALWRTSDAAALRVNVRFGRFLSEGLVDDAACMLEAFLRIDSTSPTLLYNLALLESSRGRVDAALPPAWEAAARKPDYGNALDTAGRQLFVLEDFGRAVLLYEDALALSPDDPTAWFNLACACLGGGNAERAEAEVMRALDLARAADPSEGVENSDSKRPGAPRRGALVGVPGGARPDAASEKPRDEKPEGAAHDLTVKVDPIRYRALVLLGSIRLERGGKEAALKAVEEAIGLEPGSPDAYLELGRIRLAMSEAAEAEVAFSRYLALGGTPAKALAARRGGERITGRRT